jgi:hypothetical protein
MRLDALVQSVGLRARTSVPDWMLGFFKRHHISFADGSTDLRTHVCWLQSRNFTIDLRLPLEAQQVPTLALEQYTAEQITVLANYEGWLADASWDGTTLRWADTAATLQLHNRWPEPALLHRTGNCMIEFSPSNAYVEDWRLQPSRPGPLVGLRLVSETDMATGRVRHRGGGLIVCGDYAALVLGRAQAQARGATPLKTLAAHAQGDPGRLRELFNFETSVATGSMEAGYTVVHSTLPHRRDQPLFPLDGFERMADDAGLRQELLIEGVPCERHFTVDSMESAVAFPLETGFTPAAQDWFSRESPTLGRYTGLLR